MACFATYASRSITAEMPQAWKPFISYKSGNIIAFLDNLMNSYLYGERFDEISELAYEALGAAGALSKLPAEALVDCCVFAGIDKLLIAWIRGRLESEDLDAKLGGKTIPEICTLRRKMHFGKRFRSEYFILENAFYIMAPGLYVPVTGIENIVKQYTAQDYLIDRRYRYFYLYFDRLESSADFERLRDLVSYDERYEFSGHYWCSQRRQDLRAGQIPLFLACQHSGGEGGTGAALRGSEHPVFRQQANFRVGCVPLRDGRYQRPDHGKKPRCASYLRGLLPRQRAHRGCLFP